MIYWQVGNEKFTNKWLAALHSAKTRQDIRFNLHDEAFDQVNWLKEPELTWDQLLDLRAQQIAKKHKPIVLNFSGGTDSYTIYQVFKRNRIHIDALYLRRRKTDLDYEINQEVLDFLQKEVDPTTRVIIREDSAEVFAQAYDNPEWLLTQGGNRFEFSYGFGGDAFGDAFLAQQLGTDDFVSVSGLDKPLLYFDWNGVYAYHTDFNFVRIPGSRTADAFYITDELPELHVKQCYMVLNYVRGLRPGALPRDLKNDPANFNCMSQADKFSWQEYSIKASGRFGDLTRNSDIQHRAWQSGKLVLNSQGRIDIDSHQGAGQNWWRSLAGTRVWNNYTQAILDMHADPAGRIMFPDPTNLYKIKQFPSKYYKLHFPITSGS